MPVNFNHLTPQDGLRETTNAFIFRHSDGYVWMSSMEEIQVYDGQRVKPLRELYPGAAGIEQVQSPFFEDSERNVWFCTYDRLYRFGYCDEQFQPIYLTGVHGDTLKNKYHVLHLERDSLLWVTAADTLFQVNIRDRSFRRIGSMAGIRFAVDTTASGKVKRIYQCSWIDGSGFEEVTVYGDSLGARKAYFQQPRTGRPQLSISGFQAEGDSLVWLFSDKGLVAFYPEDPGRAEFYFPDSLPLSRVRNGISVGRRYLMVSIVNEGLWLFDKQKRVFAGAWRHDPLDPTSSASNNPRDIYRDRRGRFWIAHYGTGVDHMHFDQLKFENLLSSEPTSTLSAQVKVTSVIEGPAGAIWCSTSNKGILVFDRGGALRKDISGALAQQSKGVAPKRIDRLHRDRAGDIWALAEDKLFRYRLAGGQWEAVIPSSNLFFISILDLPGNQWLIGTIKGVKLLIQEAGGWRIKDLDITGEVDLDAATVDGLFMGRDGKIYASYNYQNMVAYKWQGGRLMEKRRFEIGASVHAFYPCPVRGCIWLGTNRGLLCLDPATLEVDPDDQAPGLKTKSVYGILPGKEGRLWLSVSGGVVDYDPEGEAYVQYRPEEGLNTNEFNRSAALLASDGTYWFGGPNALVRFRPGEVRPHPFRPVVAVSGLEVNNEPFPWERCSVDKPLSLELRHWQNTVSFHASSLGHYLPQHHRLRYRIKGFNEAWTETGHSAEIDLFKLPPGSYVFEAVALSPNNLESELAMVPFWIQPPFWQRTWFWVALLLLTGFATYQAVTRYFRRRLRLQQQEIDRQNALQNERNRIASELHDDLGPGLSIIRYLSEKVLRQSGADPAKDQIARISESSRELIEKMGEVIWAMNSENDTLINLIEHLEDYSEDYLDDNGLDCALHVPAMIPDLEFGGTQRRNILLTVKETLHNIVKHAGAGQVAIDITLDDKLRIRIRDDGRGIDLDRVRRGGNGLKNMEKRMEEIGGKFHIFSDHGTVVVLEVPLPA